MRLPQWARDARSALFEACALRRWHSLQQDRPGKPHGLSAELIVSLTSYPPRFPAMALTLACLCDQTVRADRIILWIAEQDIEQLPREVRWNMRQAGVDIKTCDDIGPYKKLIPSLEAFPEAFIATADDDVYYPSDWLETLVNGFDGRSIICLRADRIVRSGDGTILPYLRWQLDAPASDPSFDLVAVGVRGILYPPHSLHPMVTDRRFMEICPKGDDLWFHHHAVMAGTPIRKVGSVKPSRAWIGTQDCALWNDNGVGGLNDAMLTRIAAAKR